MLGLHTIPQPVRDMPAQWRQRVKERRALTSVDPAADALERAANELDAAIAASQDTGRMLSSREFAASRGLRDATVRKQCAKGWLPGAKKNDAGDWEIPAAATRARPTRRKA